MKANNYAMKDWHLEHVEKVVVRFVKGVAPDASSFEKRNYKKYSTVSSCAKQIEYDIKHGVTHEEVMSVVKKIRHDKSFKDLQKSPEALQRLDELERQICAPRKVVASFF
jgi:murein L,D-transpeptidase YcbB/YkuD